MDEIVRKLAGIGLPAVVLLIAMATTGLTGAAAITAALAMLGPGGMIGGIVLLGIIGLASDALTKYGLEALLIGIYQERISNGESNTNLCQEIDNLPLFPELKQKLKDVFCRKQDSYNPGKDDWLEVQLIRFMKKEENKQGVTKSDCIAEIGESYQKITQILDELQKKGLVKTQIRDGDGAVVYIAI